ncbi:MAG: IS256 family transposase [Nevskiales bacterium]
MNEDTVVRFPVPGVVEDPLSEMLRDGARQLIAQAVHAELEEFLSRHDSRKDGGGRAAVVRNGHLPERSLLTGIGPVSVKLPKTRSRDGEPAVFRSALVPRYVRRARSVDAALPWLYLKGVSTGDMAEALSVLVGPDAANLSAPVVCRLKRTWQSDYATWRQTRVDRDRWVYLWADGIYSGLRGDAGRLCVLVVVGVNNRGQKRFLAIEDGVRESTQSWREVLLGLKARGLEVPPKLGVGDGALGFWKALEEIYPDTRQQRCWVHKTANVLNYLPKSVQGKAKAALQAIWMAETRNQAYSAFGEFVETYAAKYPKAAECLAKDQDALLAFYDFPAEHWSHIRSSNVIESAFATIRHRTDRTKGCVSRDTMLALIFKLGLEAEKSWRRIRGFDQLAKVITGVRFRDGVEVKEEEPRKAAA